MPEEKIETEVLDDDDIVPEDGRAQEPESVVDPKDARINMLEETNRRQIQDLDELRRRMDEAEEIMANPEKYNPQHESSPDPARIDYSELDPNQAAMAQEERIIKKVARMIEEKQKPFVTQQQQRDRKEQQQEVQQLQTTLNAQVVKCKKYEDWDKYEGEIYRKTDEYVKKHGLKALVDADFVESQYSKMRILDAKERISKRKKTGSTIEKPSTSASGAEEVMTPEKAFDKAWDNLSEEEKEVVS